MYATITKKPLPVVPMADPNASFDPSDILLEADEQLKLDMNNRDFGDYLWALMEKKCVSISDLSGLTGYAKLTITRLLYNIELFKNNYRLKKYVFCICIALRLDSMQFEGVVNRAGFRIQDHDDWDFFMSIMISECRHYEHVNVITVNEALIRKAMEPLLPDYAVRMLHDDLFQRSYDEP